MGMGAEAGFWQLLSLPSLTLGVLGLIGFFGGVLGHGAETDVQNSVLKAADRLIVPSAVSSTIRPALAHVLARGRADIVSTGFIVSLWTGSSAMACYVNTITIAYGMRHLRGTIRSRLLAILLYFGFVLVAVVVLPLLVIGPTRFVDWLPHHAQHAANDLIVIAYWPLVGLFCILLLMTLYHLAVPVRTPWLRALPGAALAFTMWLAGSLLLRAYLSWSFRRDTTYGTFASPVAVLLFLYLLAVAVLVGAEVNAEIDRMAPLPQTEGARRADAEVAVGSHP